MRLETVNEPMVKGQRNDHDLKSHISKRLASHGIKTYLANLDLSIDGNNPVFDRVEIEGCNLSKRYQGRAVPRPKHARVANREMTAREILKV